MYEQLQKVDWLRKRYVEQLCTLQQIADEIGCNKTTVQRALKRLGVERRRHTSRYALLNDKTWLYSAYVVEKRSLSDIAQEVGSTPGNVGAHLSVMGVRRRTVKEGTALSFPDGRRGKYAAHWKGGRKVANGYAFIYTPDHPSATETNPYVQEHRLVMEQTLGRYLEPYEIVHHRDGNRQNNDPSNLAVKVRGQHVSDHFRASHEVVWLREENAVLRERVAELEKELAQLKDPL